MPAASYQWSTPSTSAPVVSPGIGIFTNKRCDSCPRRRASENVGSITPRNTAAACSGLATRPRTTPTKRSRRVTGAGSSKPNASRAGIHIVASRSAKSCEAMP
ncbi:MAG TPA: hypothetical protein VMI54_20760 [Polyangiaceae bacterium]|nr:hypothetical protein [Polyangiaceae bacterium]